MLKSVLGVRSLKAITATASSARVLDLATIAARPAEGEETQAPAAPDRPLFLHPVLNRAIIVKHNVGGTEDDRLAPRRLGATKIIFPFDPADLGLGGQYMFVDQQDFTGALTRFLDFHDLSLERDVAVMRILDKLPTLDPFLIRGALGHARIEADSRYYRLSHLDQADMQAFVTGEIQALIELCFQGAKVDQARARRLAQRLLGDEDSPELDLLRQSLRMAPAEFSEAMFTWKGFLYYRWRARELTPQLKATLQSFSRIRSRRFERDELQFVMRCKALLQKTVADLLDEVSQRLRSYDSAFGGLTEAGDPDAFRKFLSQGSSLFLELGQRIGRLEQVVSFWRELIGPERLSAMSPDEILDGMRDLLQALSISTREELPVVREGAEAAASSAEELAAS